MGVVLGKDGTVANAYREIAATDNGDGTYALSVIRSDAEPLPTYEDTANEVAAVLTKPVVSPEYSAAALYPGTTQATHALVKASAAQVTGIIYTNLESITAFFQLHNLASDVSGGEVPSVSIAVKAGLSLILGPGALGDNGLNFPEGCTFSISSAVGTFNASGITAANHSVVILGL